MAPCDLGDARREESHPLILLVPGLDDSGPGHWQTLWQQRRSNCHKVDLGLWDNPHRNAWVNKLNLATHRAGRPVLLVAHGLGCLTVAWWTEYEQPRADSAVIGALLVAPPDVDRPDVDPRLARFAPCPRNPMPFPTALVASRTDPYCRLAVARSMARDWGSRFIDAGDAGHINVASGHGAWRAGERLVSSMIHARTGDPEPSPRRPLPHDQADTARPVRGTDRN